ncbi:MAG: YdgA family protein, partial [Gammaproteobacteria bacterium]|nr:YdgA family protein [Gammaproteobacteria bacterium]
MKKSVVAVLVLLAVVVLISPAIVGRLAEDSMGENLNWAANESGEVKVSSEKFTRGWFSSEGQHRIELRDGELLTAIQALSGPVDAADLP